MGKRFNIDQLKSEYIGKQINWLTIIDFLKDSNNRVKCLCKCRCGKEKLVDINKLLNNKIISCGCYATSKEKSDNLKKWQQEHPESKARQSKYNKQWRINNPEKAKKADLAGKSWHLYNENKIKETAEKYKQWCNDNKDKLKEKGVLQSQIFKIKRKFALENIDLSIVHPDDINLLKSGNLINSDKVRTKCPLCGEYEYHSINNIFIYKNASYKRISICKHCMSNKSSSKEEKEVADYIKSIYNGKVIYNSRDIIQPLELDLYYPDKNIAIEFNGFYWHSEQAGSKKDYHFNKFKLCKEKGIRLISIFEQDWLYKHKKVINLLNDIFKDSEIIYARKCEIKKVDLNTKSEFINKYHFDSDSNQGRIAYGLYYNNELISIMTFGKLKGQNSLRNNEYYYELVRFVTKDNLKIIGGASKLLNHFIKDYNPKYILCYSDNDFFNGEVYSKLGFKLKSLGEKSLDYQWVNNYTIKSRQQCMVHKLLNKYPEYNNIEIKGSKEKYIMEDLGYYRVYRCGNSKWELYC